MPLLVVSVAIAEPPTASRTANRGGMRAWLVVTRYGLTEMLKVRACVLSHQHASDRNSIGRLPSTLFLASSCFCFVDESATSHSRLFIQMLGGNVAAPHACELPLRQRPRHPPRPSPRRPRTRFLLRATRPHSLNPHLRHWTIPANLLIAIPTALPVPPVRMPRCPRFGFPAEHVFYVRPSFSELSFSSAISSWPSSYSSFSSAASTMGRVNELVARRIPETIVSRYARN